MPRRLRRMTIADHAAVKVFTALGFVVIGYPPNVEVPVIGYDTFIFGGCHMVKHVLTVAGVATREEWDRQFVFLFPQRKPFPVLDGERFFKCRLEAA